MIDPKGFTFNFKNPDECEQVLRSWGSFDACKIFIVMLREKDKEIAELKRRAYERTERKDG